MADADYYGSQSEFTCHSESGQQHTSLKQSPLRPHSSFARESPSLRRTQTRFERPVCKDQLYPSHTPEPRNKRSGSRLKAFRVDKKHEQIKALEKQVAALDQQVQDLQAERQALLIKHETECQQFREYIAKLERHVCPKRLQGKDNRNADALLRDLWETLLASKMKECKATVCKAVARKGLCSHNSLQIGLLQFGFYASHAEVLNIVRQIAGNDETSEDTEICVEDFEKRLIRFQPYQLLEDVSGSLRSLALILTLRNCTTEMLQVAFPSTCTLEKLKRKLEPLCIQLPPKKLQNICNFLIRREPSISGSEAFNRLIRSLPAWKPFDELRSCKERLLKKLEGSQALQSALRSSPDELSRTAFRELWEKCGVELTDEEEWFLVAVSAKHAFSHNSAKSLATLSSEVSLATLLDWSYSKAVEPVEAQPELYKPEDSPDM